LLSNDAIPRVLVVDDETDTLEIIRIGLEFKGYEVITAVNGEEGWEKVQSHNPDLVISDVMMPRMNGLELCKKIKDSFTTSSLPVVLLTARSQVEDKVSGLTLGADDYVAKPFDMRELLARVDMILRRTKLTLEANPLTGLPGNIAIQREIEKRISSKEIFAVCYMDLDNFKAYNDRYGHSLGDGVIKATADILTKVCKAEDDNDNFVGHVGGDDFICILKPEKSEEICSRIISIFDEEIPGFYKPKDRKRGYIHSVDRLGNYQKFPLVSISIAIVTNELRPIRHHGKVAQIAAELKKFAKSFQGSVCVRDRRTGDGITFIDDEEIKSGEFRLPNTDRNFTQNTKS
jgi:DNA-binding response OmpR family regulator